MNYPNLHLLDHDLARHKLALLRDNRTGRAVFRLIMRELSMLLCFEATKALPVQPHPAVDWREKPFEGQVAQENSIVTLSILRTGLVMEEAFRELLPFARCGHIGLYHDYETGELDNYLTFIPDVPPTDLFFILDGVIGTSKSIKFVADLLLEAGVKGELIRVLSLTASKSGIEAFYADPKYADIAIYTVELETDLDDAGLPAFSLDQIADRLFGTGGVEIERFD